MQNNVYLSEYVAQYLVFIVFIPDYCVVLKLF